MRPRLAGAFLRLAFRATRPRRPYEPVQIGGKRHAAKRESEVRWQAIAGVLSQHRARSVLDVGCAEGWFVRKAAEDFNCFAVGVDGSHDRVQTGEIARLHDRVPRAAIMTGILSADDLREMPRFDVVICLSVVHHVIRAGGLAAAEEFLQGIAACARKAVIFEMGTSEEGELSWTSLLPAMEGGQEKFVSELLTRSGLSNIQVIASTPGLKKDANRLMFSAVPIGSPADVASGGAR
jgi:SAM-dependent methyltransferase